MRHQCIASIIATAALLFTATTHAAEPHVHGVAKMLVAVDGNNLEIELVSPLDNLIGFERAPKSEKERGTVQKLMDQLNAPQSLFVPATAAKCTHIKTDVDAPILRPTEKSEHAHGKHDERHAELTAVFSYRCTTPAALKNIDVQLFDAFPKLQRIQAEVATPAGQTASSLDRNRRALAW